MHFLFAWEESAWNDLMKANSIFPFILHSENLFRTSVLCSFVNLFLQDELRGELNKLSEKMDRILKAVHPVRSTTHVDGCEDSYKGQDEDNDCNRDNVRTAAICPNPDNIQAPQDEDNDRYGENFRTAAVCSTPGNIQLAPGVNAGAVGSPAGNSLDSCHEQKPFLDVSGHLGWMFWLKEERGSVDHVDGS
jgi:hypothetical protein